MLHGTITARAPDKSVARAPHFNARQMPKTVFPTERPGHRRCYYIVLVGMANTCDVNAT